MYNMYLSQETENETLVLKFPILPEELEIKGEIKNKKYNVLSLGDIVRAGKRGLKSLSISSYFPAESNPDIYIRIIEKMIENQEQFPIRLIINKRNALDQDLNMLIIIDSFSHKESGGEVGDIYYIYKVTEYKGHKAKVVASV